MPPADEEDDRRPSRPRRRDDDDDDDDDDRPQRRRRDDDDESDARRSSAGGGMDSLIPYKNGMALAAYYCGVFALIPCAGAILGPLAAVFGFIGLNKAKQHPEAKGKGHAIAGIVLGIICSLANIGGPIVFLALGWAGR